MSDVGMWEVVVGFLSATFVLPVIQQPSWSQRARAAATFLWSVIAGGVTVYLNAGFSALHSVREVVSAVLLMLVSAVASYHGFAKPIGIAPAIERATAL